MVANRVEGAKTETPAPATAEGAAPSPAPGGGIKAWLPLILNLALMPALAYAVTAFVLIPKMKQSMPALPEAVASGTVSKDGGKAPAAANHSKAKTAVPLSNKVLVNVAGTMGTRYLLANIHLVGSAPNLKELVEGHDAQLRDVAASTLAAKTITDLEKAGARNLIRTELITIFNSILGPGVVTELYLTEFAIQ